MISIITGSYNRLNNIKRLISNTVDANQLLELVIVDGGSTDGTVEYMQNLNHKNIKFINYGKRSTYPHFSNLAIESSKFDFICQWDDDALLINEWDDVLELVNTNIYDFFTLKMVTNIGVFRKKAPKSIKPDINTDFYVFFPLKLK